MKFLAITLIVHAPHPVSDIAPVLRRGIPDPPSPWAPVLAEPASEPESAPRAGARIRAH